MVTIGAAEDLLGGSRLAPIFHEHNASPNYLPGRPATTLGVASGERTLVRIRWIPEPARAKPLWVPAECVIGTSVGRWEEEIYTGIAGELQQEKTNLRWVASACG